MHPDTVRRRNDEKMTKEEMENIEEAKRVGWAADILCDERLRDKYEENLRAWEGV